MRSRLGDHSLIDNHDHVSMDDRCQAVGNGQNSAVLHEILNRPLHYRLGFVVQGRGGFVENDDWRFLDESPRDGHPLFLPAGK